MKRQETLHIPLGFDAGSGETAFVRFAAKVLVVLGLFAVGIWILLAHAGLIIPKVAYKGVEAYGLPAGFGFVIAGVLVLWLWKIQKTVTTTTTTTTTHGDGGNQTVVTTSTQSTVESYAEAPDEGT